MWINDLVNPLFSPLEFVEPVCSALPPSLSLPSPLIRRTVSHSSLLWPFTVRSPGNVGQVQRGFPDDNRSAKVRYNPSQKLRLALNPTLPGCARTGKGGHPSFLIICLSSPSPEHRSTEQPNQGRFKLNPVKLKRKDR